MHGPNTSTAFLNLSGETGEATIKKTRKLEQSKSLNCGWLSSAYSAVGGKNMCVTRYRSMFLKTSSASNAGMTTLVAPSEVITKATTPAACESGALVRQTRSVVSPAQYWPAISVMVPHARSV